MLGIDYSYVTLHYCLSGVLKINPEYQTFWHFLIILNILRCMNDKFANFDAFKPKIFNFKVQWLKGSLLEQLILCSKISTFQPNIWEVCHSMPHMPLSSFNQKFYDLSEKFGLMLWFLKV